MLRIDLREHFWVKKKNEKKKLLELLGLESRWLTTSELPILPLGHGGWMAGFFEQSPKRITQGFKANE